MLTVVSWEGEPGLKESDLVIGNTPTEGALHPRPSLALLLILWF